MISAAKHSSFGDNSSLSSTPPAAPSASRNGSNDDISDTVPLASLPLRQPDMEQGQQNRRQEGNNSTLSSSMQRKQQISQLELDPGDHDVTPLAHTLRLLWHETLTILALCWAPIVTYTFHAMMSLVSVYYIGQLGSTELLAAAALATSFINITGISVAYGMASAIDTLASQMVGSMDRANTLYSRVTSSGGEDVDEIDNNDDDDDSAESDLFNTKVGTSQQPQDVEYDLSGNSDSSWQITKSALIMLSPNAETSGSPNGETTASLMQKQPMSHSVSSNSTTNTRVLLLRPGDQRDAKLQQSKPTAASLSGNPRHQLGVLLQKSLAIMLLCSVPISIIWLNTDVLLERIARQDPEIARLAGRYCTLFLPGFPLFMIYEAMKRFLQAQGHVRAPMYGMIAANLVNWFGHWLTVRPPLPGVTAQPWWILGYDGAPVSEAVAYATLPVSAYIYMRLNGCLKPVWGGWTWDALRGWSNYMRLAVPGTIMLCCEWWAFEICALVAGLIGPNALAAHSIVQTAIYSLYMIPNGLSVATTVRIGNLLGAGRGHSAKIAATASLLVTFLGMLVNVALIVVYRQDVGVWFSGGSISGVSQLVSLILPVNAAYQVFDGLQTSAQGILRGCGRAKAGAVFTLVSYYVVGLPVALSLALTPLSALLRSVYGGSMLSAEVQSELGVVGLWWGIAAAIIVLAIGMMVFLARLDWCREVERAQLNVNSTISSSSH